MTDAATGSLLDSVATRFSLYEQHEFARTCPTGRCADAPIPVILLGALEGLASAGIHSGPQGEK
jgi:hypothetical protein